MREISQEIAKWIEEGERVALAQVTQTWGSSPRRPGSLMAVAADGRLAGSVSGGCIEGSIAQTVLECLDTGRRSTERFRAGDTDAQSVGLSCGGSADILVSPLEPALFWAEYELLAADREYMRITFAKGPMEGEDIPVSVPEKRAGDFLISSQRPGPNSADALHIQKFLSGPYCCIAAVREEMAEGTGGDELRKRVAQEAVRRSADAPTGYVQLEGCSFFYSHIVPRPKLVCIGAVHISIHLVQMAKQLGYQTIIIDPRGFFSVPERFPFADSVMKAWPQEALREIKLDSSTAVCALSHDPKLDIPALEAALASPAFYIGVLGKKITQLSRYLELKENGFEDEEIKRIYGPIGLNLGGREPSEIALSIMSQITMIRFGGKLPFCTMLEAAQEERKKQDENNR